MTFSSCPYCQAEGMVEGTLQSTGTLHFRPNGVKFMTFRTADISVASSMCSRCGGIAMKGDRQKLDVVQNGRETRPQTVSQ